MGLLCEYILEEGLFNFQATRNTSKSDFLVLQSLCNHSSTLNLSCNYTCDAGDAALHT